VLAKLNAWYENDSPGRVRFINIDLGAVRPPDYPDRQPGVRIVRVWRGEFKEELRQHPYAYGHKLSSTASGGIELETTSYSAPYLAVDAVIDQLSTGVSPPEWPMVGRRGVPGWNFLTAK
jgi:hypothetical protein